MSIRDEIKKFYGKITEDRAKYFEGCLLALDTNDRFNWCEDKKLRNNLIWCEYEDLPDFVAYLLDEDIEKILLSLLEEQNELDDEAREDYLEERRSYEEMQGWGK